MDFGHQTSRSKSDGGVRQGSRTENSPVEELLLTSERRQQPSCLQCPVTRGKVGGLGRGGLKNRAFEGAVVGRRLGEGVLRRSPVWLGSPEKRFLWEENCRALGAGSWSVRQGGQATDGVVLRQLLFQHGHAPTKCGVVCARPSPCLPWQSGVIDVGCSVQPRANTGKLASRP